MKQKQIIALVSATALAATALAGCGKTSEENPQTTAVKEAEGTAKEDLPFSKYAETVTVHLGGSEIPAIMAEAAAASAVWRSSGFLVFHATASDEPPSDRLAPISDGITIPSLPVSAMV